MCTQLGSPSPRVRMPHSVFELPTPIYQKTSVDSVRLNHLFNFNMFKNSQSNLQKKFISKKSLLKKHYRPWMCVCPYWVFWKKEVTLSGNTSISEIPPFPSYSCWVHPVSRLFWRKIWKEITFVFCFFLRRAYFFSNCRREKWDHSWIWSARIDFSEKKGVTLLIRSILEISPFFYFCWVHPVSRSFWKKFWKETTLVICILFQKDYFFSKCRRERWDHSWMCVCQY